MLDAQIDKSKLQAVYYRYFETAKDTFISGVNNIISRAMNM